MTRRLKVCHIITKLELGGAQQNTLYTVGHLDRESFEPVLISGPGGILDAEARQLDHTTVLFEPSLVRPIRPLTDIVCLFRLWNTLRKIKPDIVHTHSSKAGITGRWAARLAGVPVILQTIHGFSFNDFQRWYVSKLFILLERISEKITDRLIAVTREDIAKGLAHRIGEPSRYLLIRSGIDVARCKNIPRGHEKRRALGIPDDHRVVITVGPFKPQKNLKDFIAAARKVADTDGRCSFVIIGDGVLRPQIESQMRSLGMQDRIKLLGWRRDVGELLVEGDVFAMTSLWEGLPRAILEAMCAGLPVVANAVDGVKEIVKDGETGLLVNPGDVEGMAAKLLELLNNPDRARAMGKRGKELIDTEFDIDQMVRRQEELYRLLSPKSIHC